MPERMTWAVRHLESFTEARLSDFGDWEPFAVTPAGGLLLKKQVMIEDEKSSTQHEMSFAERYER